MTVKVEVKDNGLILKVKELTPAIQKALVEETGEQSRMLTNYIIKNHLSGGTTEQRLAVRTGSMRRLTIPIVPRTFSKKLKGGTQFAAKYAGVHVGPRGSETTIKPIKAKYLAIPIGAALTAGGAPRYSSPRAVPGLSPITTKKGNLLLAQTSKAGITPFFLLLKETKVPARIWPREILQKNVSKIARGYRKKIQKLLDKEL